MNWTYIICCTLGSMFGTFYIGDKSLSDPGAWFGTVVGAAIGYAACHWAWKKGWMK